MLPKWELLTDPQGICYNVLTHEYAIVDIYNQYEVYVVDPSGALVAQFDTHYAIGAPYSAGIACSSAVDYAIVDHNVDEVYMVDASGVIVDQFDIAGMGCANPTGMTYNVLDQEIVIVDSTDDAIYITDTAGTLVRTISTSVFGSTSPQDIAFNPQTTEFAVVDDGTDRVYVLNFWGTIQYSFPVDIYGCTTPSGLGYNAETEEYVISDDTNKMVIVTDTAGIFLRQFATHVFFGNTPQDIDYLLPSGNYAVADNYSYDEVYIVNSMGFGEMSFDTYNFGAWTLEGLAYDPTNQLLFLVDSYQDEVYILDIPKILEATTITGTFSGSIVGDPASLITRETGEGFLSAELVWRGSTYSSPGFFDQLSDEVTFTFLNTPYGDKLFDGSVSEDLNMILFPSPLGLFQRKLQ